MATPSVVDTRNVRTGVSLDETYVSALLQNYPEENGQLKTAIFYINADTHDDENVANGSLAIYHQDAKIHPDSIPASLAEFIVVVPVLDDATKPQGWKDADFESQIDTLNAKVPQYSDDPPTLDKRNHDTNSDGDVWKPELGQVGNFAGIFKRVRSNMRDADYFVVVKSGAEHASQQLRQHLIAEGDNLSFGDLVKEPRLSYVNALALRNCQRLAYNIAQGMKLPIPRDSDVSAYTPTSYVAKPFRAEPTKHKMGYQQSISSIRPVEFKGKECVGVFHRVRPASEARVQNLVIGNPYDGIHVFHMDKQPLGFAVPADTGTSCSLSEANTSHPDMARRSRNAIWEGPQTAIKALAPNVNHEVDNEFYRAMDQYGWKQSGRNTVSQLVPVIIKVSNEELKRE